jgi:hypothetical protein
MHFERQLAFELTWGDIGGVHRLLAMITSRRRLSRGKMEHPQAFLAPGELTRERSSAMLRLTGVRLASSVISDSWAEGATSYDAICSIQPASSRLGLPFV